MSHYAKVENGLVTNVIVAEQDFINTLPDRDSWIQTSYNTHGNVHPENRPLRKNYAGIGYSYDPILDAFIPPKPTDDAILNTSTGLWEVEIPITENGNISI